MNSSNIKTQMLIFKQNLKETFFVWKSSILISLLIWFITTVLQIDRLFFSYDQETSKMLMVKVSYFIFLLCLTKFILYTKNKISSGDSEFLRGWQIFKVYFSILLVIMLLVWPGTWQWDDLWTLIEISQYNSFHAWQHIFTGYFHDIFLQLLPFPAGIIIIRNFINAICVAFAIVKLEKLFGIKKFKNKLIDYSVKLIPFLLPPVLIYQFSGYRIGQYVFLELAFLVMLISGLKEKEKITVPYISLLIFLCVICSCWRTESFLYIPSTCIAIIFYKNNILSKKRKIIIVCSIIIGFIVCNNAQQKALGNSNYEIISLATPCTEVIRIADKEKDKDLLDILNKVVSVNTILKTKNSGTALYWQEKLLQKSYTKEDYNNFLKAFLKLSIRYPKVVINERLGMFIHSIAKGGRSSISDSYYLFEENANRAAKAVLNKNWFAFTPTFKKIRKKVVNALGFIKIHSNKSIMLRNAVYGVIVPILCLLYAFLYCTLKKKWFYSILSAAVIFRIVIVILTEPDALFMYYLSFYFLGYILLFYYLLYRLFNGAEQNIDGSIRS